MLPLRPSQGAIPFSHSDREKIRQIKELLIHRSYRDYFLFFMGVNSGLRISDILPLRVWDVKSTTHLKVKEKKTGNIRRILMTDALTQMDVLIKADTHRSHDPKLETYPSLAT